MSDHRDGPTGPAVTRRNDVFFRPDQPAYPRRLRHQRRHGQAESWVCARRAAEPVAVLTRSLAGGVAIPYPVTQGSRGGCLPGGQPGARVSAGLPRRAQPAAREGPLEGVVPAGRGLSAAVLARMRGSRIEAAVVWQHVCAGDWASHAATVSRRLDTGQMPSLPGPRHRPRPPLVRATRPSHARSQVRVDAIGCRHSHPGVLARRGAQASAEDGLCRYRCGPRPAPLFADSDAPPGRFDLRQAISTGLRVRRWRRVRAYGSALAAASPSPCLLCPPSGHFTSRPPGTRTRAIPRLPVQHRCLTPRWRAATAPPACRVARCRVRSRRSRRLFAVDQAERGLEVTLTMYPGLASAGSRAPRCPPCSPYNTEWWVLSREPDIHRPGGRPAERGRLAWQYAPGGWAELTRASPGSPGRHAAQSGRPWRRADGDTACRREHTLPAGATPPRFPYWLAGPPKGWRLSGYARKLHLLGADPAAWTDRLALAAILAATAPYTGTPSRGERPPGHRSRHSCANAPTKAGSACPASMADRPPPRRLGGYFACWGVAGSEVCREGRIWARAERTGRARNEGRTRLVLLQAREPPR